MDHDPDRPDAALRSRLLERVRRSVALHGEYTTVRHAAATAGQTLWSGTATRVLRLRLGAGAELPWSGDAQAQEVLVLHGALVLAGDAAETRLGPRAHLIRERELGSVLHVAEAGAEVYLRERRVGLDCLPELEARWWRSAEGRVRLVQRDSRRWAPVSPGVDAFPLWGDREVVSMLVRFAPGASVPDHHHALEEDCYVLDGEMFLGDILLRAGDYQYAPAGGGHWGETSDVGVLFFFHGWVDPALTGR